MEGRAGRGDVGGFALPMGRQDGHGIADLVYRTCMVVGVHSVTVAWKGTPPYSSTTGSPLIGAEATLASFALVPAPIFALCFFWRGRVGGGALAFRLRRFGATVVQGPGDTILSIWLRVCLVRSPDWAKRLPHPACLQAKGCSPVRLPQSALTAAASTAAAATAAAATAAVAAALRATAAAAAAALAPVSPRQ